MTTENKPMELTGKEVELLNTKTGLKRLLQQQKINPKRAAKYVEYEKQLEELQREMIFLQEWAIKNKEKIVILFEGRDAAGKGGAIRRITEHINPRYFRIVALDKPTEIEREQWYFQRYIEQLPKPGEIVFFDRSWYNRAIVEPVNGFCTGEEYRIFMKQVNNFEKMIAESGIRLIKLYFSISKSEQAKRFEEIKNDPLKKWKMSPVDERAQELWDEYTKYKKKMFKNTGTTDNPWHIIRANRKTQARIKAFETILNTIPYKPSTGENVNVEQPEIPEENESA